MAEEGGGCSSTAQGSSDKKLLRQAVVVIHGMGEQKPGDTLRQMADAVLAPRSRGPRYISRPDKVTDGPDARRLLSFGSEDETLPQTEIYEYHWAHLMPGNKISDLRPLLRWILFANPLAVPRIAWAWILGWALVLIGAFVIGWVLAAGLSDDASVASVLAALGVAGIVITVVGWLLKILTGWVTSSFVDVARYVNAAPSNQQARDNIREGAVELLAGLHKLNRYSRVVIVAHSLGSFIAYDAIHYLWARMNQADNTGMTQNASLDDYEKWVKEAGRSDTFDAVTYQAKQRDLWAERRRSGNPWLVTDLVSLGSPLAYAQVLLARNKEDFGRRVKITELPSNPPERERPNPNFQGSDDEYKVSYQRSYPQLGTANVVYHGAPFAPVRWTNIYFSTDWFAGPLVGVFGKGVRDVKAATKGAQRVPLVSHSHYFTRYKQADDNHESDGSVAQMRAAIGGAIAGWVPDRLECPKPNVKVWPPKDE